MELTQEQQVAQSYKAAMDSVNLLQAGKPTDMEEAEWLDCVKRNKDHLEIMLAKDYWTTEDLAPLQQALLV